MILLATCEAVPNGLSPRMLLIMAGMPAASAPRVARAGAVINGEVNDTAARPQDTVDARFDREIEKAFRT